MKIVLSAFDDDVKQAIITAAQISEKKTIEVAKQEQRLLKLENKMNDLKQKLLKQMTEILNVLQQSKN